MEALKRGHTELVQGYLAEKKHPPPYDHHRTLGIVILQGPRRGCPLRGQQMPSPRPWKMIRYFHSTVRNPS